MFPSKYSDEKDEKAKQKYSKLLKRVRISQNSEEKVIQS